MKRTLLTLAAIAVTAVSFAQSKGSGSMSGTTFGVRAGINLAKFGGDAPDSKFNTGLNIGVDAVIPVATSFAIQPELAYSEMGDKQTFMGVDIKTKITYLTLPVLGKYTFSTSGFSLYLGPQLGIRMGAKSKSPAGSVDIKEGLNTVDIAGVFGMEFMIPNTGFLLSGRYQLGFSDIAKDASKVNNNGASILVGYRFGTKK